MYYNPYVCHFAQLEKADSIVLDVANSIHYVPKRGWTGVAPRVYRERVGISPHARRDHLAKER